VRVLLAPDKFAGTLSAEQVAQQVAAGWHDTAPADPITALPMADGGPGFLAAIASASDVEAQEIETTGPSGEPVTAHLLLGDDGMVAYVEAAQCCGLALVTGATRPLEASTFGLVALLEAALDAGARRVVIGVGGTASTDGGRPVVEAMAGRWPTSVELVAATDVESPLLGPAGAACSFGPQKGATEDEVRELEQRLAAWAASGSTDPNQPGAGAGGGLGYGLMRLGGVRVSGAGVVAQAIGLAAAAASTDLVVTGEGRLDFSSLSGKVVSYVAGVAAAASRPCVVLTGASTVGRREAAAAGIDEIYSLSDLVGAEPALGAAAESVRMAAGVMARDWSPR
jgi:glycerate kinase